MNTRQGILITTFSASLFMNFASYSWAMWSVLTTSLFMLLVTDFMFFEVRGPPPRGRPAPCATPLATGLTPRTCAVRAGQRVLAVRASGGAAGDVACGEGPGGTAFRTHAGATGARPGIGWFACGPHAAGRGGIRVSLSGRSRQAPPRSERSQTRRRSLPPPFRFRCGAGDRRVVFAHYSLDLGIGVSCESLGGCATPAGV